MGDILIPCLNFPINITTDADRYRHLYRAMEAIRRKHNTRKGDVSPEARAHRKKCMDVQDYKIAPAILAIRPRLNTVGWTPSMTPDGEQVDPLRIKLKGEGLADPNACDLKALTGVDLDADAGTLGASPDPLEDFRAPPTGDYTKSDPGSDMTVLANSVDVNAFMADLDQWLYKNAGAAHFGETFTHDYKFTAYAGDGYGFSWAVSNNAGTDDARDWHTGTDEACGVMHNANASPEEIRLYSFENSDVDSDNSSWSAETPYYPKVDRTGWTALAFKCYDDAPQTNLVFTLTVAPVNNRSFQYVFPAASYNYGAAYSVRVIIENLDLNEGAPAGNRRRRLLICGEAT